MALVDYSSSNSASAESLHEQPPAKRRREDDSKATTPAAQGRSKPGAASVDGGRDGNIGKPAQQSAMPPLPSTFHDLYASTVRQSVVDDPSLHQGRKRQTPHIAGNWPSHIYIEWNPSNAEHDMLVQLVGDIEEALQGQVKLHSFLTSELGSPLPLHISLSRPLSLPTATKDDFLERVTGAVRAAGSPAPFAVTPRGLAWYKSPDSGRIFLIVRVTSRGPARGDMTSPNPELLALLKRCNGVASQFGQPPLYTRRAEGDGDGDGGEDEDGETVGAAFHVSIGWTFDVPGEEMGLRGIQVFKRAKYADVRQWEIDVSAIKAKIGNAVHHIPLGGTGGGGGTARSREARHYFGVTRAGEEKE